MTHLYTKVVVYNVCVLCAMSYDAVLIVLINCTIIPTKTKRKLNKKQK